MNKRFFTKMLLLGAVRAGLITEEQIDISLKRLLRIRFRLGMFDPSDKDPYATLSSDVLEARLHQEQALKMARQSMVLLKNEEGILPLSSKIKKIALIGPNADNRVTQLGNYNGIPSRNVTLLDALRAEKGITVVYDSVSDFVKLHEGVDLNRFADKYKDVDLIIYAGGISPMLEGEEGDAGGLDGFVGGDRTTIGLPSVQTEVMKKLHQLGKPLVFVCMSGGAMAFNWEAENLPVVIQAWYGGQATGTALADILFGRYNPSGKLPIKLSVRDLAYVDETGGIGTMPGTVTVYAGNVCPSAPRRFTSKVVSKSITLKGEPQYFLY